MNLEWQESVVLSVKKQVLHLSSFFSMESELVTQPKIFACPLISVNFLEESGFIRTSLSIDSEVSIIDTNWFAFQFFTLHRDLHNHRRLLVLTSFMKQHKNFQVCYFNLSRWFPGELIALMEKLRYEIIYIYEIIWNWQNLSGQKCQMWALFKKIGQYFALLRVLNCFMLIWLWFCLPVFGHPGWRESDGDLTKVLHPSYLWGPERI